MMGLSLSRMMAVLAKEFTQLVRDRLTYAMIIGIPIILLFPAIVNLVGGSVVAALAVAMLAAIPLAIVGGPLFHVFMVFRGHLFKVLSSSSHRQRMFRYRGPN